MLSTDPLYIQPEDYLASELVSPTKHEYCNGEVFAMSGGTRAHSIITGNLFANLWSHLRRSGCRAFSENMKVRVQAANAYYYPDIAVTCHESDRDRQNEQHFIEYPRLIVEVLSPSTAAFDRGEKFADYRTLESLQEYALVSSDRAQIEIFQQNASGQWTRKTYSGGNRDRVVHFATMDFAITLNEIYEDTALLNG